VTGEQVASSLGDLVDEVDARAAHVPGARARLYDDEGHISLAQQMPRILEDLSGS
jgi:hypothetical protein